MHFLLGLCDKRVSEEAQAKGKTGGRAGTAGATSSSSPEASASRKMEGIGGGGGGSSWSGGALGGERKRARDTCRRRPRGGELADDIVPLWFGNGPLIALSVKPRARMGRRGRTNVGGRPMSVNGDEERDLVILSSAVGENAASSAAAERLLEKPVEGVLNGSELRPRPIAHDVL